MNKIEICRHALAGISCITSVEANPALEIYVLSRDAFLQHKNCDLLGRPGVYLIYADHFDKSRFGSGIYVGQSDGVGARLLQHVPNKTFWNKVLFYTSTWMNVAYAHNIEREFIACTKLAGRYSVDNGDDGEAKQLGEEDRDRCQRYLVAAKAATELANIDVFQLNLDQVFIYRMARSELKVQVIDAREGIVRILEDSVALSSVGPELSELISAGLLVEERSGYKFTSDYEMRVDMDAPFIKVCGAYAGSIKNSCGMSLDATIKAAREARIVLPPA